MTMKRTAFLSLALMGSVGILASCSDQETVPDVVSSAFSSVAECVAAGKPEADCTKSFEEAKADALKNAPRFALDRKAECEATYGAGNCETKSVTNPDGSVANMLLPAMAGFMLGNAIGNISHPGYVQPMALYRDRDKRYVNSGGVYVTRSMGSAIRIPHNSGLRGVGGSTRTVTTVTRTTTYSSSSRPSSYGGSSVSGRGGFGGTGSASS